MNPGLGLALGAVRRRAALRAAPLDAFGALFAAYGLRRLRATHAGPLLRLRRSSDNAQQDFGAGTDGWLDSAAVLAWAGGDSAFAATWYDQSGAGRDVTQPIAASQPRLVNAGVLEVAPNGRPVLSFSGSHNMSRTTTWSAADITVAAVVRRMAGAPGFHYVLGMNNGANGGALDVTGADQSGFLTNDTQFWGGGASGAVTANPNCTMAGPFPLLDTGMVLWDGALGPAGARLRRNGLAGTPRGTPSGAALAGFSGTWTIGSGAGGGGRWPGLIAEVAILEGGFDAELGGLRADVASAWGAG